MKTFLLPHLGFRANAMVPAATMKIHRQIVCLYARAKAPAPAVADPTGAAAPKRSAEPAQPNSGPKRARPTEPNGSAQPYQFPALPALRTFKLGSGAAVSVLTTALVKEKKEEILALQAMIS